MLYTVKEVSRLAHVTIKTLYYYHKIGLLLPCKISDAGYRLYGPSELERLQQILFYRELDFSLQKIKQILDGGADRLSVLSSQRGLLKKRIGRLEYLIQTLDESIRAAAKGEAMEQSKMFKGFATEEEWKAALSEQSRYVKETYGYDLLERPVDVRQMNQSASEAAYFLNEISRCLLQGIKFDDKKIQDLIEQHLDFLNQNGRNIFPDGFAAQTVFFLNDDFHRKMLENQQTGLAYYLCTAARAFAEQHV